MEPLSLAQHFDAPEDFLGSFGWVCGYSADELFLDDAVERFSRQTKDQRRAEGRINLAVMLDSGNAQIKMTDVPGVAHLPIRSGIKKKFQLMHAKVALLGFRKISDGSQWRLRLIVSTGNWTKQTIEDSLDLVWRIDFNCEDLAIKSDEVKQIQSDFTAAWGFIEELKESYDLRVLEGGQRKDKSVSGSEPKRQLDDWIKRVLRKPRQPSSRFFDNRKKSFLGQLPKMIERIGTKPTRRNYIAFGSGFYEESDAGTGVPSVLASIVKKLSVDNAILTKGAKKDVFVNPNACQSIVKSYESLFEKGFRVRQAFDPCATEDKGDERSLHAKFLFSANKRKDSKKFTSAWIYLGSGNLTKPGFARKASSGGGNLEAGVVFGPGEQLYSACVNSGSQQHVVSNFLPIQFKDVFKCGKLEEGGEYVPRDQNAFVSPLIPYLLWEKEGDTALLKRPPSGNDETTFRVFNNTGRPCPQRDAGCFVWEGEMARPLEVKIEWSADGVNGANKACIPVVDEFGRFASVELPSLDVEEAWTQLANFPNPLEVDPPEEADGSCLESQEYSGSRSIEARYPIRQMMELIENIALRQTSIKEQDWTAWCIRLEQTLSQVADSPVVKAFQNMEVNPLHPLMQKCFRPKYAECGDTPEGRAYETVVGKIESNWGMAKVSKLGALHD